MRNLCNFGLVEGRLVRDPAVFNNSDGSKKVLLTVAVNPRPANGGCMDTQFVRLQAYIPAEKAEKNLGPYDYMHKGDLVFFEYGVRSYQCERNGRTDYEQVLQIKTVAFRESKAVTDARASASSANGPFPSADELPD